MILVVFPLLLIAFLKPMFALALTTHGYPEANGAEQVVPGEAVINGFYIVGMTSFAFFVEHGWNTWDRLRASDTTSSEIIIGKAVPFLAVSACPVPHHLCHRRSALQPPQPRAIHRTGPAGCRPSPSAW